MRPNFFSFIARQCESPFVPHRPCWPHPGPFCSNIFSLSNFPPGSLVARATYSLSFVVARRARAHARAFVWMPLPPRGTSPGSQSCSYFSRFRPARAFVIVFQVIAHAHACLVAAASQLHTRPYFAAAFFDCTLLHHMSRASVPRVFQQ